MRKRATVAVDRWLFARLLRPLFAICFRLFSPRDPLSSVGCCFGLVYDSLPPVCLCVCLSVCLSVCLCALLRCLSRSLCVQLSHFIAALLHRQLLSSLLWYSRLRRSCAMWADASGGRRSDILSTVCCAVSIVCLWSLTVVVLVVAVWRSVVCVRAPLWRSPLLAAARGCRMLRAVCAFDVARSRRWLCLWFLASVRRPRRQKSRLHLCQRPVPASTSNSRLSLPSCPRHRSAVFSLTFFRIAPPSHLVALLWFALFSYTSFSVTRPAGLGEIDTHSLPPPPTHLTKHTPPVLRGRPLLST